MHAATLEEVRRSFAAELRVVANVSDPRVVEAFAAVPRERFVGPGPWRILHMFDGYWTTPDPDPHWLYHNVLVALDESRGLNTGEPSLWAHHFGRLGIHAGDRVLQVGAGSGYFTAILAELVGAQGHVLGLEVDESLASAAAQNLAAWPQTSIRKVEGIVALEDKWDAIIAFAGATAPPAAWIDSLADGGRALIPMTGSERWGFMLRLDRRGADIAACSAGRVGFFPCAGARDDAEASTLSRALADFAGQRALKSLRRDAHDADESCWLHGRGWCLSKRELH
ncbi:MAG: protein-L-isoaspartate(D-aspartate) O-methyltransferase [Alphaproteobacteria bacterium]|nr:protein-L-isoaspartate(D-aspartate) O-methyltransferase [Alphaproteobacteria bacterium]